MKVENLLKQFEDKIKQAGYAIESDYSNNWIGVAIEVDEILLWINLYSEEKAESEAEHLIKIAKSYFPDLHSEIYYNNEDVNLKYANLELTISKINEVVVARRKNIIAGI